jgi:hypothetical protein
MCIFAKLFIFDGKVSKTKSWSYNIIFTLFYHASLMQPAVRYHLRMSHSIEKQSNHTDSALTPPASPLPTHSPPSPASSSPASLSQSFDSSLPHAVRLGGERLSVALDGGNTARHGCAHAGGSIYMSDVLSEIQRREVVCRVGTAYRRENSRAGEAAENGHRGLEARQPPLVLELW